MVVRAIGWGLLAIGLTLAGILVANADSFKECNPVVSEVESAC